MNLFCDNITWCVAHTQTLKELVAKQHLLDQGFEVYLPRVKKVIRHARKVEEKLVPLFPRYIFVGMDLEKDGWRHINGTRGVSHLLMSDDIHPAKISARVICELRKQENEEGIISMTSLSTFVRGEKIRIVDGVFKDQIAVFESMDDKSRVQLLLVFMGREMPVILPEYAVQAA